MAEGSLCNLMSIPGAIVGTAMYMSPEQARGERLDVRSDIFSFGTTLYEMLSGRRPFEAKSAAEIISAILTREAPPPDRAGAPKELGRIIQRCLEKDRERRYQTVREVVIDLENAQREMESERAGASSKAETVWRRTLTARQPEIKSLAVLPFKSLDREAKEDYLGLGIATDIITRVSQSGGLTVRPASAVRQYVNQEIDALAAARELNVDAVLDSQFQLVGDRLRVNVNLLRAADGTTLWAEKFDERFTDIFAIQNKVSEQVAQRLRLRISPAEQAMLTKRYTSDSKAYNYYAKAMYHFGNGISYPSPRQESDLAVDFFNKAIELDREYALSHAQLGHAYANIALYHENSPALIEQAKQELGIAEKLDPQLAEVHVARAFILDSQYERWQAEAAIRELRLAQQLDPHVGHSEIAVHYYHLGLEEHGVKEMDIALNVAPNNDRIKTAYVNLYFSTGRPDEALEARKRLFNRGPDLRYYLEKGMVKEAEPLAEQAYPHDLRENLVNLGNLVAAQPLKNQALLLALQGKHRKAEAAIPSIVEKAPKNKGYHHLTYDIARVYALGGRSEEALKWLRETVKEGFPCYPLFARDPFLDRIRNDPAFVQFMTDMKTRWEGYKRLFE